MWQIRPFVKPILLVLVVSNQNYLYFFNILCAIGMFSIKIIIKVNHLDTSSIKNNVLLFQNILIGNYLYLTTFMLQMCIYIYLCIYLHVLADMLLCIRKVCAAEGWTLVFLDSQSLKLLSCSFLKYQFSPYKRRFAKWWDLYRCYHIFKLKCDL